MRRLNVQRFNQEPSGCTLAASAALGHYYNPAVDLKLVKKLTRKHITTKLRDGMWLGESGRLLNALGFRKVTAICSDLDFLDYSWSRLSKRGLISKLEEAKSTISSSDSKRSSRDMLTFLKKESCQNKLIIDYAFAKYIKMYLDQGVPVMMSFNWTMFFKYPKYHNKKPNAIRGDYDWHAVVCAGYSKTGVYIIDSHGKYYKYRLKKFRKGTYHVKWEDIMMCMGLHADVIVPEDYDPEWMGI